jgi:hypothetical protein
MTPTDAQRRLLAVLDAAGGRWVHLKWLDRTPLLDADDFPTVPSLIENGWADYRVRSVRITQAGTAALLMGERQARA